jgi:hypothetical protein
MFRDEFLEIYKGKESTFTYELVKFITKHFYDPKIPNPDLKEIYLTRLNILM